jgi:hypothetical protein
MSETFSDVEGLRSASSATARTRAGRLRGARRRRATWTEERLQSWFKLQRELRAIAMRHDHLLRKEETRKWKLLSKDGKARARRR